MDWEFSTTLVCPIRKFIAPCSKFVLWTVRDLIGQIRWIGLIRRILFELLRHLPDRKRLRLVRRPPRQTPVTQEILKIEEQLFKAGAGHVEQAQLCLRRCGGGAAAFGAVLTPRTGGLASVELPRNPVVSQ